MRRLALLTVFLSLALTAGVGATPAEACLASNEDRAMQEAMARGYARDHGVAFEEALRRLDLQDRVSMVAGGIIGTLGDHFAGASFDNEDGGLFKVGYTAGADLTRAQAIVAACQLESGVAFVPSRWSWRELTAAQRDLSGRLSSLGPTGRWGTGLVAVDGAYVLKVWVATRGLSPEDSAAIDEAIAATPVTVVRVDLDLEGFGLTPDRASGEDLLSRLTAQARALLGRDFACAVQPDPDLNPIVDDSSDVLLFVTRRTSLPRARRLAVRFGGAVRLTSPRYGHSIISRILDRARARLWRAAARLESPYGRSHCPRVVIRVGRVARRRAATLVRRYGRDRIVIRPRRSGS
jgi:hypothetical protein